MCNVQTRPPTLKLIFNSLILVLIFIGCSSNISDQPKPPPQSKSINSKLDNKFVDPIKKVKKIKEIDKSNGYKELEWGADISKLEGFKKIESKTLDVLNEAMTVFTTDAWKKDIENHEIGGAKVKDIYYLTFKNNLVSVLILMETYVSRHLLKQALIKKYGQADNIRGNELDMQTSTWEGDKTSISLKTIHTSFEDELYGIQSFTPVTLTYRSSSHLKAVADSIKEQNNRDTKDAMMDL